MKDGYGLNSTELFAYYNHDTSSWKTPQASYLSDGKIYSETLPRAGTMQNGKLFMRPASARPTSANEFLFLPTPRRTDGKGFYVATLSDSTKRRDKAGKSHWMHKAILFYGFKKGIANPRFSEWMMGFPEGWLLIPSEQQEMR